MRHLFIVVTLICAVGLVACGEKKKSKANERCDKAKSEAAEAWKKAADGWGKLHAKWAEAKLITDVQKELIKYADEKREGVDVEKLPAIMKRFDEYVKFKVQLCHAAKGGAEKAQKAVGGDQAMAMRAARMAQNRTHDLSGVRPGKEPWKPIQAVNDLESETEKAKTGTSEAKMATEAIEKACAK
jgi:hypothetical protein